MNVKTPVFLGLLLLFPTVISADDLGCRTDFLAPYFEAQAAYQAGDLERWRDLLEDGLPLWDNLASVQYKLAEACALTGQSDQALKWLSAVARQGFFAQPDTNQSFVALHHDPGFQDVASQLKHNGDQVGGAQPVFTLPSRDFFPEGITWDPVSGDFFAGSLSRNQILRWSADGTSSLWLDEPDADLWYFIGLKVQADKRRLWTCRRSHADSSASGVFVYNLDDGKLINRYDVRGGCVRLLNDLAIAADGTAYITDSDGCSLWKLDPGSTELSPFLANEDLYYPNGIVLSPDDRYLFVAQAFNMLKIDLANGAVTKLQSPDGLALGGADGLSWFADSIISIHNGVWPQRVCRVRFSEDYADVLGVEVLERAHPLFGGIPTTGVVAGSAYHFIANSQMQHLGDDRRTKDVEALSDGVILRIELDR